MSKIAAKLFNDLPEHEKFYMLKSMNTLATLAELSQHTSDAYLRRIKFSMPSLNAPRKKVLDGVEEINRFFNVHTKKKSEDACDDKMVQLFRVFEFFIEMDATEIENFMNGVDDMRNAS